MVNFISQKRYHFFFFFLLIFIEFLFFRHYINHNILPYYPTNFDQNDYLFTSYAFYVNLKNNGWMFPNSPDMVLANSFLFIPQTIFFYLLLGCSRATALNINFLYFATLQLFIFVSARKLTKNTFYGITLIGLLLSTQSAFFWAGGIADYRIDFVAWCLYGIVVTCIMQSAIFLNRKWTIVSACLSVYLILLRYITGVYLFGLAVSLLAYFSTHFYIKKASREESKIRIKNCFIYFAIILVAGFLIASFQKDKIYNYYILNHIINSEKYIRALQVGVIDIFSNIFYYPQSILLDHLGKFTLALITVILLTAIIFYFLSVGKRTTSFSGKFFIPFLIFTISIPLIALTLDLSKSPVVANVLIVPLLWLIVWITFLLLKPESYYPPMLIAAICIMVGFFNYYRLTHPKTNSAHLTSLKNVTQMHLDIGDYMIQHHKKGPIYFMIDQIVDFLPPKITSVIYFEKRGKILITDSFLLGHMLNPTSKEIKKALAKSDILIVNLKTYPDYIGNFPYNLAMNKHHAEVMELANHNYKKLRDYVYDQYLYRVYVNKKL